VWHIATNVSGQPPDPAPRCTTPKPPQPGRLAAGRQAGRPCVLGPPLHAGSTHHDTQEIPALRRGDVGQRVIPAATAWGGESRSWNSKMRSSAWGPMSWERPKLAGVLVPPHHTFQVNPASCLLLITAPPPTTQPPTHTTHTYPHPHVHTAAAHALDEGPGAALQPREHRVHLNHRHSHAGARRLVLALPGDPGLEASQMLAQGLDLHGMVAAREGGRKKLSSLGVNNG
jgi:hypothetical protein